MTIGQLEELRNRTTSVWIYSPPGEAVDQIAKILADLLDLMIADEKKKL